MGNEQELTLEQIVGLHEAIGMINKKPIKPIKLSYRVGKLLGRTEKVYKEVEDKKRELIESIGVKKDDGTYHIPLDEGEKIKKFQEEYLSFLREQKDSIKIPEFTFEDFENDHFEDLGIDANFFVLFEPALKETD